MYINHEIYAADVASIAGENLPWEKLNGKNLLLTGASGLIGTIIVDVLMKKNREENLNVKIYAAGRNEKIARERFADYFGDKNFEFVKLDVNEPIKSNFPVDYIIHAASNTHPLLYSTDPVGTVTANIIGTHNLLEFGRFKKISRLVFISSVEIYGKGLNPEDVFDENYCGYINCNTLRAGYPEAKRAGEALCQAYISQYNLDVVIARPSRIYGATMRLNDSKAMSEFIMNGVRGEDIVLKSQGVPRFSYCYGADCVRGLLYCLLKGECGEAYNISDSSEILSLREIAEYISSLAGRKVVFELPNETQAKGFSKAVNAIMPNDKLRSLGWTPKDDTHSGVRKSVEILRSLVERKGN
ncbi:MAG: NAD-dependent epimerase/dehydratase family protein [Selenomonadaceae bacterium]|nr:NAD-dependent epimerase/dehydratase family protein [Selenomonadaceae bacterium]